MKILIMWFLFSLVVLGLWVASCQLARRYEITDQRAIAGIVGEYAVNDEYGMRIFAHAIRNRGTLKGVYGVYARHNLTEPGYIWELASLAWFESKNEADISNGADSWYSYRDYLKYGIPKGKQIVQGYGNTIFFKTTNKKRR